MHDNEELARRANLLLVQMCGVAPPHSMIGQLLSAIFSAIQKAPVRHLIYIVTVHHTHTSQSWKVRLKALPILQSEFTDACGPVLDDNKLPEFCTSDNSLSLAKAKSMTF